MAAEIISDELTVRDVEALVRELSGQKNRLDLVVKKLQGCFRRKLKAWKHG